MTIFFLLRRFLEAFKEIKILAKRGTGNTDFQAIRMKAQKEIEFIESLTQNANCEKK